MQRREIARKFDEIVAFAEVERFIDTAVKHYSSGMYMRLAFAVAAHLETEILLVDEVLAVGDAEFQKKCLGKMGDVARGGRTVLFVSHNMPSIVRLCTEVIWIEQGQIAQRGSPRVIVPEYLSASNNWLNEQGLIRPDMHAHPPRQLQFTHVQLLNRAGKPSTQVMLNDSLRLRCKIEVEESLNAALLGIALHTVDGILVFTSHHNDLEQAKLLTLRPGGYLIDVTINARLAAGRYTLDLFAKPSGYWGSGENSYDWVEHAVTFDVETITGDGRGSASTGSLVMVDASWSITPEPNPLDG
jgi:lipopolysaccharide transport system ATP-binding protein